MVYLELADALELYAAIIGGTITQAASPGRLERDPRCRPPPRAFQTAAAESS